MSEQQPGVPTRSEDLDVPLRADKGDQGEDQRVLDAMATHSADGQVDDASGNDAAAGAASSPRSSGESGGDREPHGPS
jgi:hypothetical protein